MASRRLVGPELEVALGELCHRMAGLPQVQRTRAHVVREYERDKYGWLRDQAPPTSAAAHALMARQWRGGLDVEILYSVGAELVKGSLDEAFTARDEMLDGALRGHGGQPYCELGCGFGYHLGRLGGMAYGGDLSQNAVWLGRQFGFDVEPFDFQDPESYRFLRPGSTVFTCWSAEQLPTARCLVEGLRAQRGKIRCVVHLEAGPLTQRFDPLGMLRNDYVLRNDYNRDLEQLLSGDSDIEVLEAKHDVIGVNPLNPSHLLVWRFR